MYNFCSKGLGYIYSKAWIKQGKLWKLLLFAIPNNGKSPITIFSSITYETGLH